MSMNSMMTLRNDNSDSTKTDSTKTEKLAVARNV